MVAVAGTRADDMRGDEETRSFYKTSIERIVQIDCRHSDRRCRDRVVS